MNYCVVRDRPSCWNYAAEGSFGTIVEQMLIVEKKTTTKAYLGCYQDDTILGLLNSEINNSKTQKENFEMVVATMLSTWSPRDALFYSITAKGKHLHSSIHKDSS
jgi:hypothetical protein